MCALYFEHLQLRRLLQLGLPAMQRKGEVGAEVKVVLPLTAILLHHCFQLLPRVWMDIQHNAPVESAILVLRRQYFGLFAGNSRGAQEVPMGHPKSRKREH